MTPKDKLEEAREGRKLRRQAARKEVLEKPTCVKWIPPFGDYPILAEPAPRGGKQRRDVRQSNRQVLVVNKYVYQCKTQCDGAHGENALIQHGRYTK